MRSADNATKKTFSKEEKCVAWNKLVQKGMIEHLVPEWVFRSVVPNRESEGGAITRQSLLAKANAPGKGRMMV